MRRFAATLLPVVLIGSGVALAANSLQEGPGGLDASPSTRVDGSVSSTRLDALPVGTVVPLSVFTKAYPRIVEHATASTPADRQAARAVARGRGMSITAVGHTDPVLARGAHNGSQIVVDGYHVVTWSTSSQRPGSERGVTALYFHRDGSLGASDAAPLADARLGTHIVLTVNGRHFTYAVSKVQHADPDRMPLTLLDQDGPPRLAVVSCAGAMRRSSTGTWGHSSRVIVWATPVR